tara:strand:- start:4866 stop:5108 length:243 start_codon:yes stop_codon:yes gene_type:complete
MTEEKPERKSIITKRIGRKVQTALYENLVLECEFTEEITWGDLAERKEKSEKITKLLILDFQRTLQKTMDELQLQRQAKQ